jgi:hypothetical protein
VSAMREDTTTASTGRAGELGPQLLLLEAYVEKVTTAATASVWRWRGSKTLGQSR